MGGFLLETRKIAPSGLLHAPLDWLKAGLMLLGRFCHTEARRLAEHTFEDSKTLTASFSNYHVYQPFNTRALALIAYRAVTFTGR